MLIQGLLYLYFCIRYLWPKYIEILANSIMSDPNVMLQQQMDTIV